MAYNSGKSTRLWCRDPWIEIGLGPGVTEKLSLWVPDLKYIGKG